MSETGVVGPAIERSATRKAKHQWITHLVTHNPTSFAKTSSGCGGDVPQPRFDVKSGTRRSELSLVRRD